MQQLAARGVSSHDQPSAAACWIMVFTSAQQSQACAALFSNPPALHLCSIFQTCILQLHNGWQSWMHIAFQQLTVRGVSKPALPWTAHSSSTPGGPQMGTLEDFCWRTRK